VTNPDPPKHRAKTPGQKETIDVLISPELPADLSRDLGLRFGFRMLSRGRPKYLKVAWEQN
jgi:hypothetical protein